MRFDGTYAEFKTLVEFDTIFNTAYNEISALWLRYAEDKWRFINGCIEFLKSLYKKRSLNEIVVSAAALVFFIDERVTYDQANSAGKIDFSPLFNTEKVNYYETGHLNSDDNLEQTGIWLNPKFEPGMMVEDAALQKVRPLGNRDSVYFFNNKLNHFRFFNHKKYPVSVKNIFLNSFEASSGNLRIAFSPMCSNGKGLLKIKEVNVKDNEGFQRKGFLIEDINNGGQLNSRYKNDLSLAGELKADIFFGPEILGTEEMTAEEYGYLPFLSDLFRENIQLPSLIFQPSFWKNGKNYSCVAAGTGEKLGEICKTQPFVHKDLGMEALNKTEDQELLLIHIPQVACVSAMICAEFLAENGKNCEDVLFSCLGVDLLLVPSFSSGERDFINKIGAFRQYGVNVIWGNSCSAVKEPENAEKQKSCLAGAVFIAGTGDTFEFGDKALEHCGFRCSEKNSCVFIADFPMKVSWTKPRLNHLQDPVRHYFK